MCLSLFLRAILMCHFITFFVLMGHYITVIVLMGHYITFFVLMGHYITVIVLMGHYITVIVLMGHYITVIVLTCLPLGLNTIYFLYNNTLTTYQLDVSSSCSFCLVIFLLLAHSPDFSPENSQICFVKELAFFVWLLLSS